MSAQKKKTPGTAVRLFSNLEGQRVRLGVVAVSIVLYVGLAIWFIGFFIMSIWVGYRIIRGAIRLWNAKPI